MLLPPCSINDFKLEHWWEVCLGPGRELLALVASISFWGWGWDMTEGAGKPWGILGDWLDICLGYNIYVFLPFQLLMFVIVSRDFCLLLLASIQLILAPVQRIRCPVGGVDEMTLHKWLASDFSHMLERVVRSPSDTDLKAPPNKLVVLLVVPVTSGNFHFTECFSPRLCWVDAHC